MCMRVVVTPASIKWPRGGDQGTGTIQKKAGAWGMASGREMVASLGLEEKKNKDRTQSNQQQLNA